MFGMNHSHVWHDFWLRLNTSLCPIGQRDEGHTCSLARSWTCTDASTPTIGWPRGNGLNNRSVPTNQLARLIFEKLTAQNSQFYDYLAALRHLGRQCPQSWSRPVPIIFILFFHVGIVIVSSWMAVSPPTSHASYHNRHGSVPCHRLNRIQTQNHPRVMLRAWCWRMRCRTVRVPVFVCVSDTVYVCVCGRVCMCWCHNRSIMLVCVPEEAGGSL